MATVRTAAVRAVYQGRPVLVPASLADLHGPASGMVELPLRLFWSARDRIFSLDDAAGRRQVYEIVVREARSAEDLATFLNGDTLIILWPRLWLPREVRKAWEGQHPALRASTAAA